MTDLIWYPVTGNGQSLGTAYTWNSTPATWNTADWGAANTLDLTAPPSPSSVPGSGDNAYIVAGQINPEYVNLYNDVYADPSLGDPYIGSNLYAVDITISGNPVSVANLSLGSFNQYASSPSYPTLDVQGATLDVGGDVQSSVAVVVPSYGLISTNGGGTLELGDGGVVDITGTVASGMDIAFLDGAGDRLAVGGVASADPTGFGATIEGFVVGDTVDLTAVAYTGGQPGTIGSGGTLTLVEGAQSYSVQFAPAMAGDTILAAADPSGHGTDLTVACFAAGTRIMTEWGEVAVEALAEGDRVATIAGTAPIAWLGHRRIDCRRHPRPEDVMPVRVAAGAVAPGVPRRDLRLSPDHAVFLDGVLIPVRHLVNGASIVQEDVASVTYWHVELPAHAVLMAEGMPCESYLDTGNRGAFANGGAVAEMAPNFARAVWDDRGCAPLVVDGGALRAARERLLGRALAMGFAFAEDPGLCLRAGGRMIRPCLVDGLRYRFRVDAPCAAPRLVSRAAMPAETLADGDDRRRLGVMVTRLAVREGGGWRRIALAALPDDAGWHAVEGGGAWRWTDGDAALGLEVTGPLEIEVLIGDWARAWRRGQPATARLRV